MIALQSILRTEILRVSEEIVRFKEQLESTTESLDRLARKLAEIQCAERELSEMNFIIDGSDTSPSPVADQAQVTNAKGGSSLQSVLQGRSKMTRSDMILDVLEGHLDHGLSGKAIGLLVVEKWQLDVSWKTVAGECCRLYSLSRLAKDTRTRRYKLIE